MAELNSNRGFGEIALTAKTSKQSVRNATIIANTPMVCLVL